MNGGDVSHLHCDRTLGSCLSTKVIMAGSFVYLSHAWPFWFIANGLAEHLQIGLLI